MTPTEYLENKGFSAKKKWHELSIKQLIELLDGFSEISMAEDFIIRPEDFQALMKILKSMRTLQKDFKKTRCSTCQKAMIRMEESIDKVILKYFPI